MSIDKGDYVECVDASDEHAISEGSMYVVEEVFPGALDCRLHGADCCGFGVTLSGIMMEEDGCFCSERFSPVYRPKKTILKQVLIPVRQNETSIQTRLPEKLK